MKNTPVSARRSTADALHLPKNIAGHLTLSLAGGALIALTAAGFAATRVAVKLQGYVEPECAISGNFASGATLDVAAAVNLPDITKPGRVDYGFTVNCNAPFAYRLEAKHGALTHMDGGVAREGFAKSVPYDVAMVIPTDRATIVDRCSGESIRSGQVRCHFSNSGNGIALASRAQLTLAWIPAGTGLLLAGKYSDNLTITVGVRP